ncbi:MAG TPA: [FeFe] hydrogenase H-cluster radical SAM maturase HydG, partial [Firmicutes bacterium]|nr:[FeFe] hydrogenase H-cluster radical SAM maturase HydG [Bacillota bacterium]
LTPEETAYLVNIKDSGVWEEIFKAAMKVKQEVYGNRIVLFAPLYLSSKCVNNCAYCGFRGANDKVSRNCLSMDEIRAEIAALTREGHKRLLTVYGEHNESDADYIVDSVKTIYAAKNGNDDIRRVNINAAPMFVEEYKKIKEAQIGTYQVFQETYHKATYAKIHPENTIKGFYKWRLFALHRAQEAGISDVAIGALFGLYDWRFEVISLLYHSLDLEREFKVGCHTISFPRLEPAVNTPFSENSPYKVSDEDFKKIVAVLRLAVPYTGLILTARESPEFRRELIKLGISQIDAGTNIALGGYNAKKSASEKQQFEIADSRTLDDVIYELVTDGYIPSFCTADYRCGRVGCEFMDYAKTGTIKKFCIPNAVLTFKEYLIDYASAKTKEKGEALIGKYLEHVKENFPENMYKATVKYLEQTEKGERDLYF